MDLYEQEMYNFLTRAENFKNMLRVMDQYKPIRVKLIEDFWAEVKKKVREKADKKRWIVQDNWHAPWQQHWGFFLLKENWKIGDHVGLAVSWESLGGHPHIGTFINQRQMENQGHFIWEETRKLDIATKFKMDKSEWWPFWNWGPVKFNERAEMEQILPGNRLGNVEIHANLMLDLANAVEEHYDVMVDKYFPVR